MIACWRGARRGNQRGYDAFPAWPVEDGEGGLEGFRFRVGSRGEEEVSDGAPRSDAVQVFGAVVFEEATFKAVFVGVIHVTMVEEADDFRDGLKLFPCESKRGGLQGGTVCRVGAVKALFGQGDSAGFSFELKLWLLEIGGEHLDIFEGDFWGIEAWRRRSIVPERWVKKIFWVGVKRHVPREVSFRGKGAIKGVDGVSAAKAAERILLGGLGPVVIKREVNVEPFDSRACGEVGGPNGDCVFVEYEVF